MAEKFPYTIQVLIGGLGVNLHHLKSTKLEEKSTFGHKYKFLIKI